MIRVGLESVYKNGRNFSVSNSRIEVFESNGAKIASAESAGGFRIYYQDGIVIEGNGSNYKSQTPIWILDASGGELSLGNRRYRGMVELSVKGTDIVIVNVLSLREYLYSMVPSEMPSGWHLEALKAQACAGRTYAVTQMNNHKDSGYNLCDTIHCQVYLGAGNEAQSTTSAVNATANQVIYYNNSPISAVFYSSSGGVTASSENVWQNPLPYLRSVEDPFDTTGKRWTRQFSWNEVTTLLRENGANIGTAVGAYISKTSDGGRVMELTIVATGGNKVLEKEAIRTFFSKSTGGSLESRYFMFSDGSGSVSAGNGSGNAPVYVLGKDRPIQTNASGLFTLNQNKSTPVSDNGSTVYLVGSSEKRALMLSGKTSISGGLTQATGDAFVIVGAGWGHGVGLSQHGANGMAQAGFTYDQILKHYYQGVEIRP